MSRIVPAANGIALRFPVTEGPYKVRLHRRDGEAVIMDGHNRQRLRISVGGGEDMKIGAQAGAELAGRLGAQLLDEFGLERA